MEHKCKLCNGDFKDPRLLNCYHSFCRICLDEYLISNYQEGEFLCPLCTSSNSVPANGARGLSKNKFMGENSEVDCDLCSHKVQADSVCRDCNKKLCKSCLITHIYSRGSKLHNVISLGTNNVTNSGCSIHKNQELLFFCETCERPICNSCNQTHHKSHRSKDIGSVAAILREQLKNSLQNLTANKDTTTFQSQVTNQQRIIKIYQEDLISAIDERTKELHRLVDEVRGEFVRKVVNEKADTTKRLAANQETLNTSRAAVEDISKFGWKFLKHAYDIDAVVHIPKIQEQIKKLQNIDIQIGEITQKTFYPSPTDMPNLETIFGSFKVPNQKPKEINPILKRSEYRRSYSDDERRMTTKSLSHDELPRVTTTSLHHEEVYRATRSKNSFSCSNGIVTALTLLPDGSVCACLGNEGVLEIFSQSGRRKGNHTFQHQVDDVVVDKNGIFYVSSNFEKKILKIVNKNEEVFAETRLCVRGLATDGNGGLVAGMTEKNSFLDSQQDGYITEISENNTIKRVVDDSRIRYPARIAIGYDQCIVVSDWIQLCVMICSNDRIIGTYAGSRKMKGDFIPRGICSLSNGDIVVVDISSNKLHWLSPVGKLRRVVPVDNEEEPWSVAADGDDTVWVGTKNGRIVPITLI